jgi:pimeloyl-ACP methyl ester carboxylesterase
MNNRPAWVTPVVFLALLGTAVGVVLAVLRENPDRGASPPSLNDDGQSVLSGDALELWACPENSVSGVTCAYVPVPADPSAPDGQTVDLFVARIGPPGEVEGPPIVVLGQYGRSNIQDLTGWRASARRLNREVFLLDHRGSGQARPHVTCSEIFKVPWLEIDLAEAQALATARGQRKVAAARCAKRWENAGLSLSIRTETLAQDLEAVRVALEVDQWVVAGNGESAPLAVTYAVRHPDQTAGLILLRAAPGADDRLGQRQQFTKEVLVAALGCSSGTRCSAGQALQPVELVQDSLGSRSQVFTATVDGGRRRVSVSSATVLATLGQAVIDPELREGLEPLLDRLADGQYRVLAQLRAKRYSTHDYPAIPARLAMDCLIDVSQVPAASDDGTLATLPEGDVLAGGVGGDQVTGTPTVDSSWLALLDDPIIDPEVCRAAGRLGVSLDDQPMVPTLIVNNRFDYLAPASAAETIERAWSGSTTVVLSTGAEPTMKDSCGLEAVAGFLAGGPTTLEEKCT